MGLFSKKKEQYNMNSGFNSTSDDSQIIQNQSYKEELERARAMFAQQNQQMNQSMDEEMSQPVQSTSQPMNLNMQSNMNVQSVQSHPAFMTLSSSVPPPPRHNQNHNQESVFLQGVQITKQPATSGMQDGEDFHLPDFEDSELKELAQISMTEKEEPKSPFFVNLPKPTDLVSHKDEMKLLPPERQIQMEQHDWTAPTLIINEPSLKSNTGDKYVDMRVFFNVKETVSQSKDIARSSEESMANQHYKLRFEDYETLSRTMNEVQQKLMLIENKIFGGDNLEVK